MLDLFIMLIGLTNIKGKVFEDSTELTISTNLKRINIYLEDGDVNILRTEEQTKSKIYIKKSAYGNKKDWEEWRKNVKVSFDENKEKGIFDLIIEPPKKKIRGIKNEDLQIVFSIGDNESLNDLNIFVENGNIKIENINILATKIELNNGNIRMDEVSFDGNVRISNGNIEVSLSHKNTLNIELIVINGNMKLKIPEYTTVYPEIINGCIKGDIGSRIAKNIKQIIKCNVINGNIIVERIK